MINAYHLFIREMKDDTEVKALPAGGERFKKLAEMWNALPVEERADFTKKAKSLARPTETKKVSKPRRQTGYQLFIHEKKSCEEIASLPAGPARFVKLGEMWQALKGVEVEGQAYWNEKAKTLVPAEKPVETPKAPIVRRQNGYQLFIHEKKSCVEIASLPPGPARFVKMGEMWQTLKGVEVEGQAYWNEKAKAL